MACLISSTLDKSGFKSLNIPYKSFSKPTEFYYNCLTADSIIDLAESFSLTLNTACNLRKKAGST